MAVNAAVMSWTAVSSADSYVVEAGTSSGASDVASVQVAAQNPYTLGGLAVARRYFVRVRARNQAGTSGASNEVRIESVDLRNVIDALYFGSGPLVPQDGFTACISGSGRWITYAAGVTVRLIVSSTNVSALAQQAVQKTANQWAASTVGTNSVILQLTGDPDPRPGANEITIATHPDPVSQGCGFDRGCTFLTVQGSLLIAARSIIGPSNSNNPSSYSHDAVGHGALGMCHIDGTLIGGARNTLMGGGPNVFSCSSTSTSDTCIAETLTPLDLAAAGAVYASGLPRGASRSAFLSAGLVNPFVSGAERVGISGNRHIRLGPDTEIVVVEHR